MCGFVLRVTPLSDTERGSSLYSPKVGTGVKRCESARPALLVTTCVALSCRYVSFLTNFEKLSDFARRKVFKIQKLYATVYDA